jgi:hypothetical protein
VQRHFRGDIGKAPHEKVGCTHSRLERAEWMFRGLAADAHGVGICIEPTLNVLEHMLVLPARDPTFLPGVQRVLILQSEHTDDQ